MGFSELVVVLVIVLLLFGSSRLPALGRGLGDAIRGFKDGMKGEAPPQEKKELPRDTGSSK